uniref:Uncharacterized protein n=1 Tax=Solanum lycopersicum TaxID=4081 RepID=A0A3Q7IFH3_SOLLC
MKDRKTTYIEVFTFWTSPLLGHIFLCTLSRSSFYLILLWNLTCLELICSHTGFSEKFSATVKKFSLLKELHFCYISIIKKSIETISLYNEKRGLKTILSGFPHLESFDLRQCLNVHLEGDIGKRCSQEIKYLRHA